jgi:hypothetical protein
MPVPEAGFTAQECFMQRIIGSAILSLGLTIPLSLAVPLSLAAAPADSPVAAADIVPGVWQHHKVTINYFGITAAYSCDGLEEHVRNILLHLGARKDVKVYANGCPRGSEVPSHTAWIQSDFYTLAPAESGSTADAVKAHWATRQVTPRQPFYMGDGDCELIQEMKDLVLKNFSLRDVQYRTDCVPHQIVLDGFGINGQALIAVDQSGSGKEKS